ncbi:alpha/beta hydrolase [Kitasatospora sp. McL0602]|uniref:alpha/beta hydrolase n=1 Tax=Kitasatospora sp. McL0602 TaxID=3439530 RepID=UPI003F89A4E9
MASRLRRTLLAALVVLSVALPVSAAARPGAVPAPAPVAVAAFDSPSAATSAALVERYAANRAGIRAAEQAAADHGDRGRAVALHAMAGMGRQFLTFDGRDGGRSVEVFGDLAGAERIAVLVPGSDTSLDSYERLRAGAAALSKELGRGAAVVAWLGYRTPSTVGPDVVTPDRAIQAAPELQGFVGELRAARPTARLSVLCHSYGSVVCGQAAARGPGLDVADIVLFGSPGVGVDSVAALHTRATVWAGRATGDWIGDVPHLRLQLPFATLGFGADPVSAAFGAQVFAAGDGGHSDYLKPGSVALAAIARIVSPPSKASPPSRNSQSSQNSQTPSALQAPASEDRDA